MISPKSKLSSFIVGHENTRIICIDNVFIDPKEMIDGALNGPGFKGNLPTFYPGHNAPILRKHVGAVLRYCIPLIIENYQVPSHLTPESGKCFYGLVSKNPESLKPQQCMPHVDDTGDFYFAILIYLGEGPFGGTSFYRHRATGFERVNQNRQEFFFQAMGELANEGVYASQYHEGNSQEFEQIGQVDYKSNRLVIYPSSLLHSGNTQTAVNICDDPKVGRLTANLFVRFSADR